MAPTHKLANSLLGIAIALLALVFSVQQFIVDEFWLAWLDNAHWSIATAAAAALAGLGYLGSRGADRAARRWFFSGLLAYFTGQVLWDIQVLIGWNPFPSPSDIFYLLLGPGCLLGLIASLKVLLPKTNHDITLIDAAMVTIAVLALTLTLYLPRITDIDVLSLAVMTAYPVVLLSAGCFGILMILHVHPRAHWSWILFQAGIGMQGLVWMWWNYQALSGTTMEGSLLNELFSVATIIVGVSAMHWHMSPSSHPAYVNVCEKILRMLPLVAVVVAALATILVFTTDQLLPGVRYLVLLASLSVVMLATWRQGLMLEDSQRLLEFEQAMSESHRFLQVVIDTVPTRIFWKDQNLNFMGCNSLFAQDAGFKHAEELKGKSDYDMAWKNFAELYRADDREILHSGIGKFNFDEQVVTATGDLQWIRTSKVPLRNSQQDIIGLLGVYSDITATRELEEEQRIAAVTFETQEAILVTDPDSSILRVNQAFQDITGYSADEVIGKNPRMLSSGRHDAAFYQAMWAELASTGKWSGEIWDKRKNGEIYPKYLTITAVYDYQHRLRNYVAVFRDITQHKKSEQEIYHLAFYDFLTNLPNRRMLLERLHKATMVSALNNRYGALVFIDLDNFKTLNDTRGHDIGDMLLVEVSKRVNTCVRKGDTVARLGGDEFVIVLEGLDIDAEYAASQAEIIAEKVRDLINRPFRLGELINYTSPSIGIVLFKGYQVSTDDLLRHADTAMYQAKAAGRNHICFYDPSMQHSLNKRAEMESDMRLALEKNQYQLYFQIQVDQHQQPTGAEVLLRWQHPERGLISPVEFIPLAEETGLIVPLGLWVLQTACEQLKSWQQHASTAQLALAVNVSTNQFRQPEFVAQVQRILQQTGINASRLKLEITESTVLENIEDTILKMRHLKQLGIGFSMDDFGTGYSSLQYLKRLPLNQIKIDQSFVRDLTIDPNDAAIVKTIIAMAEALGLDVIAEGVETEAQRAFLDEHGCHAFQGYLFGKPVPLMEFEKKYI